MHRPGIPRADTGLALALLRLPVAGYQWKLFILLQTAPCCDLLVLLLLYLNILMMSVSVPVHSSLLIPLTLPLAL